MNVELTGVDKLQTGVDKESSRAVRSKVKMPRRWISMEEGLELCFNNSKGKYLWRVPLWSVWQLFLSKTKRNFKESRVGGFQQIWTCHYRTRNSNWRPRKLTLDPVIACSKLYGGQRSNFCNAIYCLCALIFAKSVLNSKRQQSFCPEKDSGHEL